MEHWMSLLKSDDFERRKANKRGTFRKKRRIFSFFTVMLTVLFFVDQPLSVDAEVYRSVPVESRRIALTFDDGPHPFLTDEILSILEEYNVKATFFEVGVNVINYPDVAKRVIDAGHEIGNHTFSHRHLERMSEDAVRAEIEGCEDALEELAEYRPHLFRPPEGAVNSYIQQSSDVEDYHLILWSVDTRDWEVKNASKIAKTVLSEIQPGDIVLMHDFIGRGSQTPQALRILLPILLEQGYEPVTVSTLLGLS